MTLHRGTGVPWRDPDVTEAYLLQLEAGRNKIAARALRSYARRLEELVERCAAQERLIERQAPVVAAATRLAADPNLVNNHMDLHFSVEEYLEQGASS